MKYNFCLISILAICIPISAGCEEEPNTTLAKASRKKRLFEEIVSIDQQEIAKEIKCFTEPVNDVNTENPLYLTPKKNAPFADYEEDSLDQDSAHEKINNFFKELNKFQKLILEQKDKLLKANPFRKQAPRILLQYATANLINLRQQLMAQYPQFKYQLQKQTKTLYRISYQAFQLKYLTIRTLVFNKTVDKKIIEGTAYESNNMLTFQVDLNKLTNYYQEISDSIERSDLFDTEIKDALKNTLKKSHKIFELAIQKYNSGLK